METCWLPPTQSCCNVHNVHDVHSSSRERPPVDVLMSGPSSQVVSSLGLHSQSRSNTGQRQWQVRYCEALSFFWRERKRWRYLGHSCELTARGNYLDLADLRFDSRFAISSLSTFSMKLERLLFSAFASATSLDFNARSILKDIVVSFTVAADTTLQGTGPSIPSS